MKIELSTTEFVEIIRALQADEEPNELSDAMKKIIDKYNVNIQDAYAIEEKEYRPKAACAL